MAPSRPDRFAEDLRVTLQQIGHDGTDLFERADDICATAYWYQPTPHAVYPPLPPVQARRSL